MKTLQLLALSAMACCGGVLLAQDVSYNFDKAADFSKFKTYAWKEVKGAQKLDGLMEKQLIDAIDAELARKGMVKKESEPVDLFIGYQVGIGQEKQMNTMDTGWGYGAGWGRYGGGMGSSTTTTSTIYIGQLVVDMYDAAKHEAVWRGTASKTIDTKAKPEKRQKNLTKAIAKLFKKYPPQVKS